MYVRSRWRRADLRLRMYKVIQVEAVVHEDLFVFVLSGAWMSSNERRVVK